MIRSANPTSNNPGDELARRLAKHVEHLAGVIGPRHCGRVQALTAAADYVAVELETALGPVERQEYDAGPCRVVNIVGELKGSRRSKEIVILGAHYDTVENSPGADDNASAVAALIEAAQLLKHCRPSRTIRFVAFPCEEQPHGDNNTMGSQVYAQRCRDDRERILGMVCLEMLGYYTDEPNSQRLPPGIPRGLHWLFPNRGDFLAVVGNPRSWCTVLRFRRGFRRATRLPLFPIVLPESIPEIRRSDNRAFWDQGYQAVMVTDTSFLRNPHYHQSGDTPDTLDYRRLSWATLGVSGAVAGIAGGAWPPPAAPGNLNA